MPWQSWWPQELPTPEEARALVDPDGGTTTIDILFAHDALRGPGLQQKLLANRHQWREEDLTYAEHAADVFTERALAVISDQGLVISGHYHFRHSANEDLVRPDGTTVRVRSEVRGAEWGDGAVGLLNSQTLDMETWAIAQEDAHANYDALRKIPADALNWNP